MNRLDIPDPEWLLDCEPRPAQIEGMMRGYHGLCVHDAKDDEPRLRKLPWFGEQPAPGFCYFMQMRTGKTPLALNEFMVAKKNLGIRKMMVFAPSHYRHAWQRECVKFGVDVPTHVFDSKDKDGAVEFILKNKEGVLITHYETMAYDDMVSILSGWVDDKTYAVTDESVLIKNHKSLSFRNSNLMVKPAAMTRCLTGLPAPQEVSDLWAQLRWARHIDGFDYYAFRGRFSIIKKGFKGHQKVVGIRNEVDLDVILDKASFRAKRKDWATHFDSDFEVVDLEMLPRQKKAYYDMEREFITWLDSGEAVTVEQVITKHMKLQQISSGFIIDEEGTPREIVPPTKVPKFQHVQYRVEKEVDGKLLIVAHYTETIERLLVLLKKHKPALIAGRATMKRHGRDIEDEKARFNNDPSCSVMIGQGIALKYGHTLMGTRDDPCLSIAYVENSYSLDTRKQTEERPQGEGQVAPLHIWDYWSTPVERKVVQALQRKESIADTVMEHYKNG